MSSYEGQCKKWAAKRYGIPLDKIADVYIEVNAYSGGGCPTCGPETSQEMDISVYGPRGGAKGKGSQPLLKSECLVLNWSTNFASIVKEIFEA